MTVPFDPQTHLLQLDDASIPESFVEFGPRDHMVVHVHRFNGAKENIANYAIPARFVILDTENEAPHNWIIEPFDLRKNQLSFNDPPPAEGYSVGDSAITDFGKAMIYDVEGRKAQHEAEMKAIRDEVGPDQS